MEPIDGASAPKKRTARRKRKADPAFKPVQPEGSGSEEYNSDTPPRRQNPRRTASSTSGGTRIIYNEGRSTEPGGRKPIVPRKRIRSNPEEPTTSGELSVSAELPANTTSSSFSLSSSSGEIGKPEDAKSGWFFTRMFQGMRNFLTKTEAPLSPDQKGSNGSKKDSSGSRETVAVDSKAGSEITIDPEVGKKRKMYNYNEAWHIPSEQLDILETISSGTFGDVARARLKGTEVAVKTLRTPTPHVGEKVLNLFLKEVSILSKLRHPSIVLFIGACISPKLCIVMEYVPGGSLYHLLHIRKETLGYAQCIRMAVEIAEGLNYLHECSPLIIHRDVKSSNILVTATRSIKLADFGISKETTAGSDGTMTGFMGTSSYMSPEMIRGSRYTEKVDIYSFGVLLCEMYSQKIPFKSLHALQVAHKVLQGERPEIPDKCPAAFKILLNACWHESPAERPTFKQIIQALNKL